MSADKDRAIRRQKQKRAKASRKLARTPVRPAGTDTAPVPAKKPAE